MSLTATFTQAPDGVLTAVWDGSRLEAQIRIQATFEGEPGEIQNGGYRQYVRGVFKADGQVVAHYLCGATLLSPTEYREDGCPPPGCSSLGYRTCPPGESPVATSSFQDVDGTPDMIRGPVFVGRDTPGISGQPGMTLEMHLEYRGVLVNAETHDELAVREWTVQGAAVVPVSIGSEGPTTMESGRQLNAELVPDGAGGWNGSLAISGADGSGRSEPPALRFQAEDGDGARLGIVRTERNVASVGSPRHRTWVIRFAIARGQPTPDRLTGALDDEEFSIPLVEKRD